MGFFHRKRRPKDPDLRSVVTILGPYKHKFAKDSDFAAEPGEVVNKTLTPAVVNSYLDQAKFLDEVDEHLQSKIDGRQFKKWRLLRDEKEAWSDGIPPIILTENVGKMDVFEKLTLGLSQTV